MVGVSVSQTGLKWICLFFIFSCYHLQSSGNAKDYSLFIGGGEWRIFGRDHMAFRRKGVGSSCRQQSIKVGEFRKLAAIRLPFNCQWWRGGGERAGYSRALWGEDWVNFIVTQTKFSKSTIIMIKPSSPDSKNDQSLAVLHSCWTCEELALHFNYLLTEPTRGE